ncbi:MAG: hypothetical protein NZ483_02170 [Verrucomicrobiae bacterium]|nr:hypothetical protein [Verrucomicrobiae bacterium]MDW8343700.1 hypothetical protein [Verrucomicrobiae bacterium]
MEEQMKRITGIATVLAAVLTVVGCGKKESEPPAVQVPKDKPAVSAPSAPAAPAPSAVEKASEIAAQVATLIDQARALINKKDYQAALNVLQQVSALKLTPEQQKLVQELQATAQRELAKVATDKAASEAGKAVGGMLGK